MTTLEVSVDSVDFDDSTDDSGLRITSFEGWSDSPSARAETIERPNAHGDFDTIVTRGPRLITMTGWVYEPDDAAMLALGNQFRGILAEGNAGTISVTEYGVTTTATVRLYGDVKFARVGTTGFANWTIMFQARNPRRYGASHTFPASGTTNSVTGISHNGTATAAPVLEVSRSSGSGGYTVTGPGGESITVTTALVSGHPHTIDLATGWLTVDGARVIGGMTVYQPWYVPKGSSVSASSPSGTTLEVTVKDTYL